MKLNSILLVIGLFIAPVVATITDDLGQLESDLLSLSGRLQPASTAPTITQEKDKTHYNFGNYTLSVVKGDITKEKVDVIVNAANPQLHAGGGVCGAIFAAANDPGLQQACNKFGGCATGQACPTESFGLEKLGIEYIIHAVGPDCEKTSAGGPMFEGEKVSLTDAYFNSLKVANTLKHRPIKGRKKTPAGNVASIAFPFISSNIYKCDIHDAATAPFVAIKKFFAENPTTALKQVELVAFSSADFKLFNDTIKTLYGL